jgi:hypothetical protein
MASRENRDPRRREWRLSLRATLLLVAAAGAFLALARWVEPILVAGTLYGGAAGAMIDAMLRRRLTSVWIALLLFSVATAFLLARVIR